MKLEMSTTSQKSAETVVDIEELLKQILERVPALSLISFKCVSKHWLSFISDPDFRYHHTLRNPRPKISAFFNESFNSIPPAYDPSKILTIDGCNLRILQSCNDLFLCHNIPVSDYHANHHPVFVVNPTTNQFRAVSSPNVRVRYEFVRYALAFDPSKSPHYKVVCVTNHPNYSDEGHHKIDIYSSETGEWKHLQTPFFHSPSAVGRLHDYTKALHFDHRSTDDAMYCNGAVHWIRSMSSTPFCVLDGRREFRREATDVLHYFDTSQERFLVVSAIPPVPSVVENIPLEVDRYGSIMPTIWPSLILIDTDTLINNMILQRQQAKKVS